ncbi:MAG: DUF2809 domain-containing protein [Vulcanimicrobiota bacterium]
MRRNYALATLVLLAVEIFIALKVHDQLVRPFLGDALVVVLIYCAAQTLLLRPPRPMALACLLFAFTIEVLQAFDFAHYVGADQHRWLSVLLGRTFSWWDFVAYTAGYLLIRLSWRWP